MERHSGMGWGGRNALQNLNKLYVFLHFEISLGFMAQLQKATQLVKKKRVLRS